MLPHWKSASKLNYKIQNLTETIISWKSSAALVRGLVVVVVVVARSSSSFLFIIASNDKQIEY